MSESQGSAFLCSLFQFAKTAIQTLYSEKYNCCAMCLALTAFPQSTALLRLTELLPLE